MPPYVHPHALCESVDVGEGTRVWAFAHVMDGARIGRDCNIGGHSFIEDGATIGDGCTIKNGVSVWRGVHLGDHVFVGPNAVFTNDLRPRAEVKVAPEELVPTYVEAGATIGANATIVCGITIGTYAMIGAGAVVTSDVPPYTLMLGVPARAAGLLCRCGKDRVGSETCEGCRLP